jgi:hypothetical protein
MPATIGTTTRGREVDPEADDVGGELGGYVWFAGVAMFGAIVCFAVAMLIWLASVLLAWPHDAGQWTEQDPVIAGWFATLKQPDNPSSSCCGTADAYWADKVETDSDGHLVAVITDERDDAVLSRPHVPVGTKIIVPPYKIKWDRGNPTGHIVIFLTWERQVLCYVQNGGV